MLLFFDAKSGVVQQEHSQKRASIFDMSLNSAHGTSPWSSLYLLPLYLVLGVEVLLPLSIQGHHGGVRVGRQRGNLGKGGVNLL